MPLVGLFGGIRVTMYGEEHPPPHFHATYAEFVVQIEIDTLRVIKGSMPRNKLAEVLEWAEPRRDQLKAAWDLAVSKRKVGRIP